MDLSLITHLVESFKKDTDDFNEIFAILEKAAKEEQNKNGDSEHFVDLLFCLRRIRVKYFEMAVQQMDLVRKIGQVERHPFVVENFAKFEASLEEEKKGLDDIIKHYGNRI
jgi:hypothetical protein